MEQNSERNIVSLQRQKICKICGGAVRHFVTKEYVGFPVANYYQCDECNFLYSSHIAETPGAEVEEYYRSLSFEEADAGYSARAAVALLVLKKFVAKTKINPLRVLDYGCGTGLFVGKCRDSGIETFGYDRYYSNQSADISPWILNEMTLKQGPAQFDLVTALEVVEHSPSGSIFEEISRFIKPDGYLTFSTWIFNPMIHDASWEYLVPGHCSIYSYRSLQSLRNQLGFTKEYSIRHPFPRAMKYTLIGEIWKKARDPLGQRQHFAEPLRDAAVSYLGARLPALFYPRLVRLVFGGTKCIC